MSKSNEMTEEQAKEILTAEATRRQNTFRDEYLKLCQRHGLQLIGVPSFTQDGRVGVQLIVGEIKE